VGWSRAREKGRGSSHCLIDMDWMCSLTVQKCTQKLLMLMGTKSFHDSIVIRPNGNNITKITNIIQKFPN
jgi:hypothetical protein